MARELVLAGLLFCPKPDSKRSTPSTADLWRFYHTLSEIV